jgi:endoglucanase
MINVNLLKKICETPGAPGFENRVRSLVLKEIKSHVDNIEIDNMGFYKKGGDQDEDELRGAACSLPMFRFILFLPFFLTASACQLTF